MGEKIMYVICFIILPLILGITLTADYKLVKQYNELQAKYDDKTTEYDLHPCYFCGKDVKIEQVNDDFYIECDNCKLHTTYFDHKKELAEYWNKVGETYSIRDADEQSVCDDQTVEEANS